MIIIYDNIKSESKHNMKLKRLTKSIAAILAAAAVTTGMSSMKVKAAGPVIDDSVKGSITIHKYIGDALNGLDEYPSQEEMADTVKNAGDALKPVEGVVFKYTKVGEVNQYTKEGTVKIGYSVDEKTKAFLNLPDSEVDMEVKNIPYYTTSALNTALDKKTQTEIETKYKPDNLKEMSTNADGVATAADIPTGLYLVYEYSYPSEVNVTTRPFFVSVPTTDDGKNWVYDVNVYPKNQTESIDISKWIVSDHGETKKVDAEIGKDTTFKVVTDVPDNIGKMKTYRVEDTLGDGMNFVKEDKVYGVKSDGTKEDLTASSHYTFGQDEKKITYQFDPVSLADAKKAAKYETLEITYIVKLNEKAVVGTENVNKATLTYSKKTNVEEDGENGTITTEPVKASIYTYAVDLLKYGNGDVTKVLSNVTFQLLDKNKKEIKVAEKDGIYYLNETGQAVLTTDKSGKIYVKGLETGTYYLRETKTNKGYNLLKEDIEIKITAEEGTYNKNETTPLKVSANYTMTNGNVNLKVNNTKGFLLPATGGIGAIVFFMFGGLLVFAGVCSFRISWKKSKQSL